MLRHRIPSQRIGPADIAQNLLDQNFTTLETITDGDLVYVNASTYIGRAQASASATMHAIGAAIGGGASGQLMSVRLHGPYISSNYDFSGSLGRQAYVSRSSAGGVSTIGPASSGDIVQTVGYMIARRTLFVSMGGAYQRGGALA